MRDAHLLLLLAVPLARAPSEEDPKWGARIASVRAEAGRPASVGVYLTSEEGRIAGWSLGLCHDSSRATAVEAMAGPGLQTAKCGNPADFMLTSIHPDGVTQGIVLDVETDCRLPALSHFEAMRITYIAREDAALALCDTLGDPIVPSVMVFCGASIRPDWATGGTVDVFPWTVLRRGDSDDNGLVNISDAVRILRHLFKGHDLACPDAADANDDGVVDLADAIFLLQYLFASGDPPPDPGPLFLGEDPTQDPLGCT